MWKALYSSDYYKDFLKLALAPTGPSRGLRSSLAAELGCQPAFVSNVLKGSTHFTLDHIFRIANFLGLEEPDREFLLNIFLRDRAATRELRSHYQAKLDELKEKRFDIATHLPSEKVLLPEDLAIYYSSWIYQAVYILAGIPRLQTRKTLTDHLKIPAARTNQVIQFLLSKGLLVEVNEQLKRGTKHIHLPKDSPLIWSQHAHWRHQAMNSIASGAKSTDEDDYNQNYHFTSVISLSLADWQRVRALVLELIQNTDAILEPSPEEVAGCLNVDFFRI